MKIKINVTELYQTVETVVDIDDYNDLTDIIYNLRRSILDACQDVNDKMDKKAKKTAYKPKNTAAGTITPRQKELIARKAKNEQIERINIDQLSKEEASQLINEIFAQN